MTNQLTVELTVSGMTCENCQRHVTEALRSVDGVTGVDVSLEGGTATVSLADPSTSATELIAAVADAGYAAAESH